MDDPIAQFFQWFKERPIIAKSYLTLSFILATIVSFTSVSVYDIFYTYDIGFSNLQLWRPFSSLFFLGGLQLGFFTAAYLAYQILFYAERDAFGKQQLADYITFLTFDFMLMWIIASLYDLYFLSQGFMFALLYVTSQLKPFLQFRLLFNISVPVKYFIWVYAGFNVIIGQSFVSILSGFLVGFLYIKIKTTLKNRINWDLWPTPGFLKRVVKLYLEWSARRNPQMNQEKEQEFN